MGLLNCQLATRRGRFGRNVARKIARRGGVMGTESNLAVSVDFFAESRLCMRGKLASTICLKFVQEMRPVGP